MKNWVKFCIDRKVTMAMLLIIVMLLGSIGFFRMDREFMPDLSFPQLIVVTRYPNASSQEVENLITRVVEEQAGTARNVERIHSISREGVSVVTVEFGWGTSMDMASLNLREKIELAKPKLPRDSKEPEIERYNPFALPVVTLSFTGQLSAKDLMAAAKRPLADLLSKVKGVALVEIIGGQEREIQVLADAAHLAAQQLSILDVGKAIANANLTYPAGTIKDKTYEYVVRVLGAYPNVSDLEGVSIQVDRNPTKTYMSVEKAEIQKRATPSAREYGAALLLASVATVEDSVKDRSSYSRYDGVENVSLAIQKQADANIVKTAQALQVALPNIVSKLPKNTDVKTVFDQSLFIRQGISGMIKSVLAGGGLAFLVLLVFLKRMKQSLVVAASIPISVAITFFVMDLRGMSINTITLAGLAIGIGMIVDAAIVVEENIARLIKKVPAKTAILEGTVEVAAPVGGSILTTICVFFPFIFVSGVVGQVFKDLSWTVVITQLASFFVAISVVPYFTVLGIEKGEEKPLRQLDFLDQWVDRIYPVFYRLLVFSVSRPKQVLVPVAVVLVLSLALLVVWPKALFPKVEGGQVVTRLDMPAGTALQKTNEVALKIEQAFAEVAGVAHRSVVVGALEGQGVSPLGSHQSRMIWELSQEASSPKVIAAMQQKLDALNLEGGQLYFFEQGGAFSFLGGGAALEVEIKGYELSQLEKHAKDLAADLSQLKGFYNVRTSLKDSAPEVQLKLNRSALARLGISVTDLSDTLLTAIHGKVVSQFKEEGKEIPIRLRLKEENRQNIKTLESLFVYSPLGYIVPVSALANLVLSRGPSEILRYDQERTVIVSSDLNSVSLGQATEQVDRLLNSRYRASSDFSFGFSGQSKQISKSFRDIQLVMALSILLVFMVMAGEFESLWQPFIILSTIPLSLIGMVVGLFLFNLDFSVMAGMGAVLLAGIVVNNGIVIFEFVNIALREHHQPLEEALVAAVQVRLRPILMTACTTILGMLPLALGLGKGDEMQSAMAAVVVSGLFFSTLLTLFVLPALYVWSVKEFSLPSSERLTRWLEGIKSRFTRRLV